MVIGAGESDKGIARSWGIAGFRPGFHPEKARAPARDPETSSSTGDRDVPSAESDSRHLVILHVDLDAFYASVEQRDNPDLRGKPVVVGGSVNRGVVSAASYEARAFGIHSAMPTAEAMRRCPDLIVVPGRMKLYIAISRDVRAIFRRYTSEVEPLSLDEAFLDVTGSARLFGAGRTIAQAIKDAIRTETGLTASAGVAANKLVAKMASDMEKPDGLTVVEPGREAEVLAPLPIRKLWGIGPRTEERLRDRGFATIGDLQRRSPGEAELAALDTHHAIDGVPVFLIRRALGIDDRPVVLGHAAKSISSENTFDRDQFVGERLGNQIRRHAETVGRRLRAAGLRARTVTLKVRTNQRRKDGRYRLLTRSHTRAEAVDDSVAIYRDAIRLLDRLELGPARVRLIGVSVSSFQTGERAGELFPEPEDGERQRLYDAVDRIADRFGTRSIVPASTLGKGKKGTTDGG